MSFSIHYKINNSRLGYPIRQVEVDASEEEIRGLVEQGYLIRKNFIVGTDLEEMRLALGEVVKAEAPLLQGRQTSDCFGGLYLRHLMDKHPVFLDLYKRRGPLSIARAVLGPQVQFDQVDARVVPANALGVAVPWHIHMRVVPDPLPPFFSYPHAIHCLLYLDDVDEKNGLLCVLPGSHMRWDEAHPLGDNSDKPGQVLLAFDSGTCLIIHGNLWHRTLAAGPEAGQRRLVFFGYTPSWMRWEELGGIKPERSLREEELKSADAETREILGEFYWA